MTGAGSKTAAAAPAASTAAATAADAPVRMAAAAGMRRGGGVPPAEEELWTGGYSPKAMYGAWVGAAVATIAGLVAVFVFGNDPLGWLIFGIALALLWGGLLLSLAVRRLSVKYRLTNQRLFHEKGILRRVTDRVEVIDIDDVTVEQGIIERMLAVGTIRVTSSDRTNPELQMPGIDDVKTVADKIDRARRAERERRGLFIESV
jgi:membrane protein YdbS with pleckstrin-like domain